jgi:hypothetical protein
MTNIEQQKEDELVASDEFITPKCRSSLNAMLDLLKILGIRSADDDYMYAKPSSTHYIEEYLSRMDKDG